MKHRVQRSRQAWIALAITAPMVLVLALAFPLTALANVGLTQLSSDPFTSSTCTASTTTYHHTEVEPDTYSFGSTIVSAFQVARIFDGGACAIGFATSTNNGSTWTSGLVPGVTKYSGGTYDRATDASVTYDAKHSVWIISSLVLSESGGAHGVAILDSTSTNGTTWGTPFTTENTSSSPDKNWIVCDNTSTSPLYGNCYTEWDDNGAGNLLHMSTSSDGGQHLEHSRDQQQRRHRRPAGRPPDGTVIVPIDNANETALGAFNSTNGGASWSATTTITTISHHTVAGSLREGPLPSAEIDAAGTVYVAWADCRFERSCRTNDIVMTHSTNSTGTTLVHDYPRADRRRQEWSRSLHPWPGGQQGHLGQHCPARHYLLLLSDGSLWKQLRAGRRLHLLDERRQHLEHGNPTGRSVQCRLGGQHQPGTHGR